MSMFFALLYAFLIGFYTIFKKVATNKTNPTVVLVMFTTTSFLLSLTLIPFGVLIPANYIWIFVLKGFILAVSWYLSLHIIKDTDITLISAMDILSVILNFLVGIFIFKENITPMQIVGSVLILFGVTFINLLNKKNKGTVNVLHITVLLIAAIISSGSAIIDKYSTSILTNFQVQFWFLLFVCVFSWMFFSFDCLHKKQFMIKKNDLKNYWIYLVGFFLFIGDFMLFLAYKQPNSQMIIISILSKLKILITVISGILIFKEKSICKKLILTGIILIGAIFISVF